MKIGLMIGGWGSGCCHVVLTDEFPRNIDIIAMTIMKKINLIIVWTHHYYDSPIIFFHQDNQ